MNIDRKQLAAAFTRWESEYRENPAEFMTEEARLALETADYGETLAIWLEHYIAETGLEAPRMVDLLRHEADIRDAQELTAFAHDVAAAGKSTEE